MSCYLFQNGSVYTLADGQMCCMSWDEFSSSSMTSDREAHVLMAESDGPLLMDQVRQVRQIFSRRGLKTCVLYAAALKAFLNAHGLMATGGNGLVADDLGNKFLLTAFHGAHAPVTRMIPAREPAKIVEELRRTQKNGPLLRIFSNNADVIDALDPERKKEAVFFDTAFPAFEVLGKVKFPVELMPPEERVAQKRAALHQGLIGVWCIAFLMAGLGAGCFSYAQAKEKGLSRELEVLARDKDALEQEERAVVARTYQARLKALPSTVFLEVLDQFLKCLPPDGHVEQVSFVRGIDMHWCFTGRVSFPRQQVFPFFKEGIFREAKVESVHIQARPGLNIVLILPDEAKGEKSL